MISEQYGEEGTAFMGRVGVFELLFRKASAL